MWFHTVKSIWMAPDNASAKVIHSARIRTVEVGQNPTFREQLARLRVAPTQARSLIPTGESATADLAASRTTRGSAFSIEV
jgi:hypothetical protein